MINLELATKTMFKIDIYTCRIETRIFNKTIKVIPVIEEHYDEIMGHFEFNDEINSWYPIINHTHFILSEETELEDFMSDVCLYFSNMLNILFPKNFYTKDLNSEKEKENIIEI